MYQSISLHFVINQSRSVQIKCRGHISRQKRCPNLRKSGKLHQFIIIIQRKHTTRNQHKKISNFLGVLLSSFKVKFEITLFFSVEFRIQSSQIIFKNFYKYKIPSILYKKLQNSQKLDFDLQHGATPLHKAAYFSKHG